jgi:predicted DNA-binding transcriptional regulator AlpA
MSEQQTSEREPDVYLTSRQVCSRYGGMTEQTLWRWGRDPQLAFPSPLKIKGRNLWSERALTAWERRRARRDAA